MQANQTNQYFFARALQMIGLANLARLMLTGFDQLARKSV